jgi:hypothetical protein
MSDAPRDGGDAGGSRKDAGKIARDAAADMGEAVTLAARAAGSVLDRVGQIAADLISGLSGRGGGGLVSGVVPDHRPLFPIESGGDADTRVGLVNDSDAASEPFELTATDLVSDAGDTIPADAVALAPEMRVVAARGSDTVRVAVRIPEDARPGIYRGELRPTDDRIAPAALVIEVR